MKFSSEKLFFKEATHDVARPESNSGLEKLESLRFYYLTVVQSQSEKQCLSSFHIPLMLYLDVLVS